MPSTTNIASQIDELETELKYYNNRLEDIARRLRHDDTLSTAQKKNLRDEEQLIKSDKTVQELKIRHLRQQNSQSFYVALILLMVIMIVYYMLWGKPQFSTASEVSRDQSYVQPPLQWKNPEHS